MLAQDARPLLVQTRRMHPNTSRPSEQFPKAASSSARARPNSPGRTAMAYVLVALGPVLAWVTWISWSDEKASDAMHAAWFATVAATCVLAGGLAPRRSTHLAALSGIAIVATMATLFLWWSTSDESGLFIIGIMLATPIVSLAAPLLLLVGRRLTATTK